MRWKIMKKCENGWDSNLWKKLCNDSSIKHLKLLDYIIKHKVQESTLEFSLKTPEILQNDIRKAHELTIISPKFIKKPVEKPVEKLVENELKITVYENTELDNIYRYSKIYKTKLIKNNLNTEFLETLPKGTFWSINNNDYFTWIDKSTKININSKYSIYLPLKYKEVIEEIVEEKTVRFSVLKVEHECKIKKVNFFEKVKSTLFKIKNFFKK